MAADPLDSLVPRDNASGKPQAVPGSASPPDQSSCPSYFLAPSTGSWVAPPPRTEAVPHHGSVPPESGRAAVPGLNRQPRAALGSSEDVWTELLRVGDGAGTGTAVTALSARPQDPLAPSAAGPRAADDPLPSRSGPATDSVLDQFGPPAEPHHLTLSVVHAAKVPITLPKEFGRYRILEQLGKGSMGAIYLAHDTQLGRRVALKVPHLRSGEDGATPDPCDLDRFYREARAAATLDHPNLCRVYDVGQIGGIPYLTMAYIKGRPLSKYIRRDRPMSQRRVAIMVRKLAQALEEAHYNGVVHRDLKPSNIMVNARGDVIIMDFGLVWHIGAKSERLTRVGLVVGTPMYMSPEQASGKEETIGPGCDIYSLGVIMYELLTGRVPFEGPEAFVLGQVLFVEPPPPSRYRPDIDPRLEAICMKAMAKSLDRRYATMGELAMAVSEYLRAAEDAPPSLEVRSPVVLPEDAAERPAEVVEERGAEPSPEPAAGEPFVPDLPIEVPESGTLWKAWRQWTAIVEHFAMRRSDHKVNKKSYENLYNILVTA